MAIATPTPSRRAMLGFLAAAPLAVGVVAVPAVASGATEFRIAKANCDIARARFENLPDRLAYTDPAAYEQEEAAFLEAARAVDHAPVQNWSEFAEAFEFACDDGDSVPSEDVIYKLLADARRLSRRSN